MCTDRLASIYVSPKNSPQHLGGLQKHNFPFWSATYFTARLRQGFVLVPSITGAVTASPATAPAALSSIRLSTRFIRVKQKMLTKTDTERHG